MQHTRIRGDDTACAGETGGSLRDVEFPRNDVDVFEARRQPLQGFAIGSAPRQQYRDGVTGIFGILEEGPRLFQRPGLVKIGGAGVHDPVRSASQAGA